MIQRKLPKKILAVVIILTIILLSLFTACSSSNPAATPAATSYSASAATPAQSTETLKIGEIVNLSMSTTAKRVADVYSELANRNGGLDIGGKKYKVEFVIYDSQGSQTTGVAALNKLIFEDKVKYIEAPFDPITDTFLPITEANKVIFLSECVSPAILSPNNHYSFSPGTIKAYSVIVPALFTQHFTNYQSYLIVAPDNMMGHLASGDAAGVHKFFGVNANIEFYPASATDLSSIGTKVKNLNPDVCMPMGGGPIQDCIAIKAIAASGWKGKFYQPSPTSAAQLSQFVTPETLDGFVNAGFAMEFDPPLNQEARDYKDLYEAKSGKWEGDLIDDPYWECLKAALQQAGSLDTDKVAAVIGNGLKFAGIDGTFQMVSRPDQKNERTVGTIYQVTLKEIKGGKPAVIASIPLDEIAQKYQSFYQSQAR
jgi:branched-chain amino acid transport system substrate-binding protein